MDKKAEMSSVSGSSRKKFFAAKTVAPRKKSVQRPATAGRGQRRADLRGQTAAAKKMAVGASTTRSQRQGNCRKRSLGSRFHTGSETGSSRKRTAAGMQARGIQR